jgi:hypothetical protein
LRVSSDEELRRRIGAPAPRSADDLADDVDRSNSCRVTTGTQQNVERP